MNFATISAIAWVLLAFYAWISRARANRHFRLLAWKFDQVRDVLKRHVSICPCPELLLDEIEAVYDARTMSELAAIQKKQASSA